MRYIAILIIGIHQFISAAETPQRPRSDANIYGHVLDAKTGEHLPFVNMLVKGTRIGTTTDATGHYFLANLPPGEQTLLVSALGYKQSQLNFVAISGKSVEVNILGS